MTLETAMTVDQSHPTLTQRLVCQGALLALFAGSPLVAQAQLGPTTLRALEAQAGIPDGSTPIAQAAPAPATPGPATTAVQAANGAAAPAPAQAGGAATPPPPLKPEPIDWANFKAPQSDEERRLEAAKAKKIAAHLLEVNEGDLDWEVDRFKVKGDDAKFKTMAEISWAAYNQPPEGLEPGLEAVHYYDPPNFTYPFGIYLCVVDIDRATGETKIRRFYALDDCGTRINPMIIEGQIHGGLTEGFAVAMGQQMPFDAQGNLMGNTLMDYFLPTAVETPKWETDFTVTPSPHHPIGAKGVAESPHVGSIPTFTSAIVDAFSHLGVTHLDMPHSSYRLWKSLREHGAAL